MSARDRHTLCLLVVVTAALACAVSAGASGEERPGEVAEIDRILAESDRAGGARREKLLREALRRAREAEERLEQVIGASQETRAAREQAVVRLFTVRLRLAEVLGPRRGARLMARVKLSVESEEQRKTLRRWMGESLKELEEIGADLRERVEWARADPARRVNLLPRLQRVGRQWRWQRALARYWLARTSRPGPERKQLLDRAAGDIEALLEDGLAGSREPQLRLLKASCLREKGDRREALSLLTELTGSSPGASAKEDAMFELALARIGYAAARLGEGQEPDSPAGRRAIDAAAEAVGDYEALSSKALAQVRAILLHCRLYRHESGAGGVAQKRARARIDRAVREFMEEHPSPSLRALAAEMFIRNWPERMRRDAPSSVLVLLAGRRLHRADRRLGEREMAELSEPERETLRWEWQKAVRTVKRAQSENEGPPRPVAPESLWVIGTARMRLGEAGKAAGAFGALCEKYPSHFRARAAALRRVRIAGRKLENAIEAGKAPVEGLRVELAEALSVLLRLGEENPEADRWRMHLGWQCGELARGAGSDADYRRWAGRAIKAYREVTQGGALGLRARFLRLEQEFRLARRIPSAAGERAGDLARRLEEFSARLKGKAAGETPGAGKERLLDWGSRSEFYALALRHILLGDERALERLSGLEERWPGREGVRLADRYLFDQKLDAGQYEKAAEMLSRYATRHRDAAARAPADRFLETVREVLERGGKSSPGRQIQRAYFLWSEWLFESCEKDSALYYRAGKFRADALRRQGRPEKALALYEGLRRRSGGNGPPDGSIDVRLAIGRARCLRALGRREEAVAVLTPLCSGLPRESSEFWTAQIERAECIARSGHAEELKQLLALVRQLRSLDADLGGPQVRRRFERLVSSVEAKLEAM